MSRSMAGLLCHGTHDEGSLQEGLSLPAAAPGSDPYRDLLQTLSAAIAPLHARQQQAIETLVPTVQEILCSGSADVPWIERTLDHLLDHACMPKGLVLFKALCRHYWQLDPEATASYINAYRKMWDCDDEAQMEP